MPSYPTGVFSPTNKSAGQTIQHTHINDVQDEIVAIESGLLTGSARLNSSHSTLAALSVTGGSTLAGALTLGAGIASTVSFASSATFSAGVTFNGPLLFVAPPEAAQVELETATQIPVGATVVINWDRPVFKTNSSMHSSGTNPDRLIPQSSGVYHFSLNVRFLTEAGRECQIIVKDSSGTRVADALFESSGAHTVLTEGLKYFNSVAGSTQYLRCVAFNGTSTNSLSTDAALTKFTMVKMR